LLDGRIAKLYDFSPYDGTAQTLPLQTTYTFPSYYVFSDGVYPANYPPHPNPPPAIPQITVATNKLREFPLGRRDLSIANREINLRNNQKQPVEMDFTHIVDAMQDIKWLEVNIIGADIAQHGHLPFLI